MFKADGTPIKNPSAYVAGIAKNGYTEPLYDAHQNEIQDPQAFIDTLSESARGTKRTSPDNGGGDSKRQKHEGIFLEDGTQIKNPVDWLEKKTRYIQKHGGEIDKLVDSEGQVIRNPASYVAGMVRRGQIKGVHSVQVPMMPGSFAHAAPAFGAMMYKEDGTPIKNPAAFVEGIKKNGYTTTLYTQHGKPISDPVKFVEKASGNNAMWGSPMTGSMQSPMWSMPSMPKDHKGIYKANGTLIKNPAAYIANFEKTGKSEPLYGSDGVQIRNPVAYVAAMEKRAAMTQPSMTGGLKMFKADGKPIKNPTAYVAGIEKNGHTESIFDEHGVEIHDPVSYVKRFA